MSDHKAVNLYRDADRQAFAEARTAVERDPDAPADPSDAEVLREVCEAYTGFRFGREVEA